MKLPFLKIIGFFAVIALSGVACDKKGTSFSPAHPVTVEASQIAVFSAVLAGRVVKGSSETSDLVVGFQYSKTADILPSNSTTVKADIEADNCYSAILTGLEPATTYYFRSYIFQNNGYFYGETGSFTTKDIETLDVTYSDAYNAVIEAGFTVADGGYADLSYGFMWGSLEESHYISGGDIKDNTYSAVLAGLVPETQYWYKAFIKLGDRTYEGKVKTVTTDAVSVPDGTVDMGILMTREDGIVYNVFWARCNLCETGFVSSPEEYGDYYAWGETEVKSSYDWETYKFRTEGDSDNNVKFSKYNTDSSYGTVDNKTVLETGPDGDDVASKILGGAWRMPTKEEWLALRNKCTWASITENGIYGKKVIAANGNSIFLPAAGNRFSSFYSGVGSWGYYWSSSLSGLRPSTALSAHFYDDQYNFRYYEIENLERHAGRSIRPVCE